MIAHPASDPAFSHLTIRQDGELIRVWLEPPRSEVQAGTGAELLAALLAPVLGCKAGNVAAALLAKFRSLSAVLAARRDRLAAVPDIDSVSIGLIATARDIAAQLAKEEILERELIDCPEDLERYVRSRLRGKSSEAVHGLFLDRKDRLIDDVLLGVGTVDHAPLYPREIARQALVQDASAVILVHNHPSGDSMPSSGDIVSTRLVAKALAAIDVALHDHLIVGANDIFSMRKLNLF